MSRLRVATRLGILLFIAARFSAAFAEATADEVLRPALLEVTVNGQRGAEPMLFLRGPDGALYASAAAFGRWRMRPPAGEPIQFEGELYYRVTGQPMLRITLSEQDQAVAIDAAVPNFQTQRASLASAETMPMTAPAAGAFLDYDVLVEHVRGETSASGAFQLGLFTRHGVAETGFVATAGAGKARLVRLETSWSIDRPATATSLRVGDSISFGGPGAAPVRFGGVRYFRNYAIQPGFVTMSLPSGSGSAAVPSVIDIYVNNALQGSQEVGPGPFELTNIPVQSGGGTVQIVVRDLLGREIVSEQAYYASTQALRRGLHDFSYEIGFLRHDFGRRSNRYGEFMAATAHRYGLTDRLTIEGHAQVSRSVQQAGAGLTLLAFDLGQVGGSASVSHSGRGVGYRVAASFERRTRGLSFGARSEYASAAFAFIGMPEGWRPPRLTLQAFADLPVRRGAVGVNLLHREKRDGPSETLAGLFGRFQIGRTASVHLSARHSVAGRRETIVGAHLALALGERRTASGGIEHGSDGATGYATFQSDPPVGTGGGYRLGTSFGEVRRLDAAYVHNLPMATVSAQASHIEGTTGLRVSATGSIGFLGGDLFASRRLGESFAAVEVDGFPGLRIYADDQLVGVTGADGSLIVPGLRPFQRNRLRIEDVDLPIEAQVETLEQTVRPFARTGTIVRFAVRRERGVLMQVRLEDGSALPAGATVHVEGADTFYVAASGGEVYVPNLGGVRRVRAAWPGGRCGFSAAVPETDDPQPRLEGLICREESAYAAN
jgi:outer membrane usher protein